jgi:uncharacterized membrane protein
MRSTVVAMVLFALVAGGAAFAQEYHGVVVSTDYPSITTSNRDLIVMDLEVSDYGDPPQRIDLSVVRSPSGWDHAFVGGGGMVEAVFASPDNPANAQLWLDPPDNTPTGIYQFVVRGSGSFGRYDLPITITIGDQLPRRLEIKPELPVLTGPPTADFTFQAKLTNRSAQEGLVDLHADTPTGFQVTFKKKYADQELTSLPIEAGKDVDLEIKVTLPEDVAAGDYPIRITAESGNAQAVADLKVSVRGQPQLKLTGPEGRMSESAVAGRTRALNLTIENTGAADAQNVSFRGSAPRNWEIGFEPDSVDLIPAGGSVEVVASLTPSSEAITGDYVVTMRASADDAQSSGQFRITVRTSALWGVVAVVVIALALLVVVFAVRRYGRR